MTQEHGATDQAALPLAFKDAQLEGAADYVIVFDGGSQGNPGPGYGSYQLARAADGRKDLVRLDFGRDMTNNEAEYHTLIASLEGLLDRIQGAGQDGGACVGIDQWCCS